MSHQAVLESLEDMYAGFLANDRVRFDQHLAADVTAWESHLPALMSRQELDEYRNRRTPDQRPVLTELRIQDPRIDIWGDQAVARYELIAVPRDPEGAVQVRRVTDVMQCQHGNWVIVHHHAELWSGDDDV